MQVLEPRELERRRLRRAKKHSRGHKFRRTIILLLLIISLYSGVALFIPVAMPSAKIQNPKMPLKSQVVLPWPAYGQAAVGAVGYGVLAYKGDDKQLPMASTNKVLTALVILEAKPIDSALPPTTIVITEADVEAYNKNAADGHSVLPVIAGESLTQYQALQALLLPSANNIADILGKWAFGSNEEYIKYANSFAKKLGMNNTVIADASGFSPQTVSTAKDLTLLAEAALNNPIITEIVNQSYADLPMAGRVYNINRLIGRDGIIGIKTGNTDEAGGCYIFAAKRTVLDENIIVFGAIMGAPNLDTAMVDSLPLINASYQNFVKTNVISNGQVFGSIQQPAGPDIPVSANGDLSVITWKEQPPTASSTLKEIKSSVTAGQSVGTVVVHQGKKTIHVDLKANNSTLPVTPVWRLRYAAGYL